MSHEEPKFAVHFRAPVADKARDEMWRNIQASRAQSRVPRRIVAFSSAGLAAAAALVLGIRARHVVPELVVSARGPLQLEIGQGLVPAVLAPAGNGASFSVAFDDHSHVSLGQNSRIEVLENTATSFALKQADGAAYYDVTPGGPRRWSIETPLARIEVVGTAFEVHADATHTHVAVSHGVVLVRGELVAEHVQRLTQGQSLDVTKPVEVEQVAQNSERRPFAGASGPVVTPPVKTLTVRESKVDVLWSEADLARSSHDITAAVAALSAIVAEHPSDERAGMAALTLGRMRMDMLSEPAQAASDFATALRLGLSPALREDAQLRRCEALAAAGQTATADTEARNWTLAHPESGARFARWVK